MRRTAFRLHEVDPQQLVLWVPLLAALVGVGLLTGLRLTTPMYLTVLLGFVVFGLLALFGPARLRPVMLACAPQTYALLLLLTWVSALYLLPLHPASPMALLACVLHVTTLYVFFFAQRSPRSAARHAGATLAAFAVMALPHTWQSFGQNGAFDGLTLPVTLLFAHTALILVLWSFSQARDQLVQERVESRAMRELAHRDPLTELHNRRALEQDLLRTVQEECQECLLAVVDVDGLKQVNDHLGHAAGDDLLCRFARGFVRGVGPQGKVYRISGDEFALLLQGGTLETPQRVVEQVTRELREVYAAAGASVGTARWRPGETASAWLSRADRAMYRHKRRTHPGEHPPP
ncbi:GGDEF domain-containing protein [Deinococcus terrestris]|uniref:GGDEF domain-containing protein n=1 Tax=Deinococcus terrestris TaxID=2651870 RepID=UPI00128C0A05|nr:GGDEF domain-containing protein [Deinococcus terrestris]